MKDEIEILKALAEHTRLRIMHLLVTSGAELCCCELTDALDEPQYSISRHLKVLKQAGLVRDRKEGRWVYSFAVPPRDRFLKHLFASLSVLDEETLSKDKENLEARLSLRVGGKCTLGIQKAHLAGPMEAAR